MPETTSSERFTPFRGADRHVLFLLVEPVQTLDLFGPYEVFRGANLTVKRPFYRMETVSWSDLTVRSEAGPCLLAHRAAPKTPPRVDTLVVVGGEGAQTASCPVLMDWLRKASQRARRTVSICTASFLLGRAGLLRGRSATTHWTFTDELARMFPDAQVHADRLWTVDGPIYTSAGVTAGIDLALALVTDDLGAEVAQFVARMLVVFMQRPSGQAQVSASLRAQHSDLGPLRELQAWLVDHLDQPHTISSLAQRVAMSPRNFLRVFKRELGCPPAKFVTTLRVEAAQRQLERTEAGLEAVAAQAGFPSAAVMTRAFQRLLGTTPAAYRTQARPARLVTRRAAVR